MNLVVLGANGRTGELVVQHALAKGDTVTAVVRSEAKRPSLDHAQLEVVVGDPCDATFLTQIFQEKDAVISTLGGRSPSQKATSVYWKSAEAIVEAAQAVGMEKVVVTSSALLFPPNGFVDRLLTILVRNVVHSATRMEQTLDQSNLSVTVGRCGFLTDDVQSGYRCELGALPAKGTSISRNGLAAFLVDKVHESSDGMQIYGVARPV